LQRMAPAGDPVVDALHDQRRFPQGVGGVHRVDFTV
jgi:hypothetical protein